MSSHRRSPLLLLLALTAGGCASDLDAEELSRACLRASSCGVRPYPRVANCVEAYHALYRPLGLGPVNDAIHRCVNAAGDCAAVFACYGASRQEPRCDASFVGSCTGDAALSCDLLTGYRTRYDCAEAGLTCGTKPDAAFEARCTTGSCDPGSAATCDGDRVLACRGGLIEVETCAPQGLVCGADEQGQPACVGASGTACAAGSFSVRCEGSTLVTCVGGHVHRRDCAGSPWASACRDGACVPAGGACQGELDRCAGEALEACLDGGWVAFDCAALGLGPCRDDPTGAACRPRD